MSENGYIIAHGNGIDFIECYEIDGETRNRLNERRERATVFPTREDAERCAATIPSNLIVEAA